MRAERKRSYIRTGVPFEVGGLGRQRAIRSSRFGVASSAEETGVREARRPLWRRGQSVSRGGRPRGGRVFCASHRISTGTGRRANSHIRGCKTPEILQATYGPHPDWCEYLARSRKE